MWKVSERLGYSGLPNATRQWNCCHDLVGAPCHDFFPLVETALIFGPCTIWVCLPGSLPGFASNAQQVDAIAISGGIWKIVTQVGATFGDHFTTIADLNVLFDHLLISKGWPAMPPTLGLKGLHTSSLGCLEERNTTLRIVERHGSTILFPRICQTGALKKQKPSANALKWWVNHWENKQLGLIWFNRRKFRSETSDNMDSWKAEVRRVRREKIRRKKMQVREKVGTSWNTESRDSLCFSNDLWLRRVEK